jgi:hypothetical protein
MPRSSSIFTSFTAGEFSPRLDGRVDLAKYYNACKTLQNMLIHPHGGASRRPGTYFVSEVKDSGRKVRLIPFEFSVEQAYILEFGSEYARFYMKNGQIGTFDQYTKLLLHCDGVDASTAFPDATLNEHDVTANGTAQVDTDQKKFGTGAALFQYPTGGYLTVPGHADFSFADDPFTIDFWIRIDDKRAYNGVFELWEDENNYIRIYYRWEDNTFPVKDVSKFGVSWCEGGIETTEETPDGSATEYKGVLINEGQWYHLALIRGWGEEADDWALTLDGKPTLTKTYNGTAPASPDVRIGVAKLAGPDVYYFEGWMEEIRISKGIARWTEDFSPPVTEYLGETPYEISTPYLEEDLPALQFAQNADVMYIVHPDHAPMKLSRTGHAAWTLRPVDFINGPYKDEVTAVITSSAVSGQTTLALSGNGTTRIFYDAEVATFTEGKTLVGAISGATAKIVGKTDWGTEGVMTLAAISGTFQNNEQITDDATGDATVNGTVAAGFIEYEDEDGGPFEVGETITGATSGASGTLTALQDDGATGKFLIEMDIGSGDFAVGETIEGATSEATATVTTFNKAHGPLFSVDDVGAPFGYFVTDTWYWLEIKSVTDDVTAVAIVRGTAIPAGPANASKYRKGAWNADDGYPSSVTFHEERLVFARIQTIWGSLSGGYEDFTPGTDDADPYTYTIASDQVNAIRWLSFGKYLIAGTVGAEFVVKGSGSDESISASNISITRETTYGSANVMPARVGHVVLFLQRQGRKIRELVYNFDVDGYLAPDMTLLAEHITQGGLSALAYQQELDSILWCVRSDGVLCGMTYMREQDVVGWHRHTTDGIFESVAVIPGESQDQVWVVVRRTINEDTNAPQTKRYIEYFKPTEWESVEDGFFVDSGLTYDGAEVESLSGLDHLEGKEVAILTNAGVHVSQTVTSGEISLEWGATKVHVGLPYTSILQTMRLEAGQAEGTAQGKIKRIHTAIARLHNTIGCKIGPDLDNLDTISFRSAGDAMDEIPPIFTGDKIVSFRGGTTRDAFVYIVQEDPLPLTVLGIILQFVTFDE